MQSSSVPLPPDTGCDFLRRLPRGLMPPLRGPQPGRHHCPGAQRPADTGESCTELSCSTPPPPTQPNLTPRGAQPPPPQPQEITVKRLEMHDMLWRTMPRRKTRTQATRITVHTPDQVELFTAPLRSGSSAPASAGRPPCSGCCSAGIVTTVRDFCWLPGRRRQPMSPGSSARSLERGKGSM